jgi:hypothetical protein
MTAPALTTKSFEVAADVAKQLITLAAGIVALTITFSKDFIGGTVTGTERAVLGSAWALYFVSILGGTWLLFALAGSLSDMERGAAKSIYDGNSAIPMGIQQISFLLGLAVTIAFAVIAL